jgi:hypothetical protein
MSSFRLVLGALGSIGEIESLRVAAFADSFGLASIAQFREPFHLGQDFLQGSAGA